MAEPIERTEIKRQQRRILLVGSIVAAIPIGCQFLMLLALAAAPAGTFPGADATITEPGFWPVQIVLLCGIVLLCVGVAGNAITDCVRAFWTTGRTERSELSFLLALILAFFAESAMFSVTLLGAAIGWTWLVAMLILGAGNLAIAYALEMEIAGKG
jgi:hypothetical protein